ncbi:MAG: hypothetical protein MRJ92_01680 [Nitrospira sp.]|nr:hypothetical protein [Nitrospira sp.]
MRATISFGILSKVKEACSGLFALVSADEKPSARSVLRYVADTRLFAIPDVLAPYTAPDDIALRNDADGDADTEAGGEEVDLKGELGGWRQALEAPFDQIEKYDRYVRGVSQFDTHRV